MFDAVIVGAGFAGMYMLHRLRGLGLTARVYEAGKGVGGTWYWNRYPGARCDVESMDYSYSFSDQLQQEWHWTERYSAQPEILKYANHVADRFDLRRDIQFETRVTAAVFDERTARWNIETDRGERVSAQFCIMATGCLSEAQVPDIEGVGSFEGRWYHTGRWPHEGVDFTGLRVAVIGTGSSAIQSIPLIAQQAAHLFVFQRTPNYSMPAQNAPLDPEYERRIKAEYADFRRQARESRVGFVVDRSGDSALAVPAGEREREYEKRWSRGGLGFSAAYTDLLTSKDANDTAAEFFRAKIRSIVRDPAVADALCPQDYPLGTKRLCVDTGYYATFNRDNVTLIDVRRTPIAAITPKGVRTRETEYAVDAIVFATGFDAMTGAMIVSIEQHVDWIADCAAHLRASRRRCIEATPEAEDAWVAHVNEVGHTTLYPLAKSWYMGANVPGKPRIFMPYIGGVGVYRQKCDEVAAKGYEGFALRA